MPILRTGGVFAKSSRGWVSQVLRRRFAASTASMAPDNYNNWTKLGLIQRIKELEASLPSRAAAAAAAAVVQPQPCNEDDGAQQGKEKKPKGKRKMDPSRYSTRYIALKFAYLGKNYGGFEFSSAGARPSIEEELWHALTKTCLIFPEDERVLDFDCCEYSKCGRTDRGVSAFGQVVGLRVRSNRPLPKKRIRLDGATAETEAGVAQEEEGEEEVPFDPVLDEIQYPHVLNRILPKDIRVLAWCPDPPEGFSARFSCRERQYRYLFTQPAFAPPANDQASAGWLDIEAMRDAAKRFEGEHDFRNFCKVDPAKQMTNFTRTIFESDIVEVDGASSALPFLTPRGAAAHPKVYYFHVRGSAFLWHQIRHMVAVLFLVGQRLEAPSLVSELLDVRKNPRRPNYVMAAETPLVLWDCIFPDLDDGSSSGEREDSLRWIHVGPAGKDAQFGVMDDSWQTWRGHKMDEMLSSQLLQRVASLNPPPASNPAAADRSVKVFEGGDGGRMAGKYVGVMKMKLLSSPSEQNLKYLERKK